MRRSRWPTHLHSRHCLRRFRLDRGRQGAAGAARQKLAGAIAGRALYDGRLDPAVALTLIRNAAPRPRSTAMFKVRVIPCLDVKDGRVVKGVNFVDLRDAGDPVEAAIA